MDHAENLKGHCPDIAEHKKHHYKVNRGRSESIQIT